LKFEIWSRHASKETKNLWNMKHYYVFKDYVLAKNKDENSALEN
jgi:hypothetical protein